MRQLFLDTETTGLSALNGDRIIEIACVEMVNRKLTHQNLHFYVNPERDSEEGALRIHGISNEFLRDKPKFAEIANDLLTYCEGAEIFIHNAPFDLGFLNKELSIIGKPEFKSVVHSITDTLVMAKEMFPGKRNSLDALCDRLGVDNSNRSLHGALLDAELLSQVYVHLTRGQDALLTNHEPNHEKKGHLVVTNLECFQLDVLLANEIENSAHEETLLQIDKASQNKTLWRKLVN